MQSAGVSNVTMPQLFCADLSAKNFARCAEFITAELGIRMPPSKLTMLQSRLVRLAHEMDLDSVEQYIDYLFDNLHTRERTLFLNSATTNKTDFFRESEHFEYLVKQILPNLSKATVWSAACSTGPEPYTLAMVLSEHVLQNPSFSFSILATDISTKVLELAHKGIYEQSALAPVPLELRNRYFLSGGASMQSMVRVKPSLREKVSFHQLNLMDKNYAVAEKFDVIFLRNVLIYFEPEIQQAVVQRLCESLKPGGYLITGLSEPLGNLEVPLLHMGMSIYHSAPRTSSSRGAR